MLQQENISTLEKKIIELETKRDNRDISTAPEAVISTSSHLNDFSSENEVG